MAKMIVKVLSRADGSLVCERNAKMTATFDLRSFAANCIARGLTKSQAKAELERIGQGSHRSALSPLMRELRGEAKPRPNFAQRQAAKRLANSVPDLTTPEQIAAIEAAFVECHNTLTAAGWMLDAESESGSRYYTLGELRLRVGDHPATHNTERWLGIEGQEIRVDKDSWKEQLLLVC